MNNRFKFRAWHRTAKQMFVDDRPEDYFEWLREGQPVEIMQYTGIKDNWGKEIFEGDVLTKNAYHHDDKTIEVVFENGAFMGKVINKNSIDRYADIDDGYIEIVGNIYENTNN